MGRPCDGSTRMVATRLICLKDLKSLVSTKMVYYLDAAPFSPKRQLRKLRRSDALDVAFETRKVD